MPILESPFRPAWWLRGANRQTVWQTFLRPEPLVPRERERIWTDDGDFLDLDWINEGEGPIALIIHGLTGSSSSKYVIGLQEQLRRQGWRSVGFNFRGCSGEPNRLAHSYCMGETSDPHRALQHIKSRYPDTPVAVVGISLGGNVLLKWLGGPLDTSDITAAVVVSPPFELAKSSRYIETGHRRLYMANFVRDLCAAVEEKKAHLKKEGVSDVVRELEALGDLTKIRTIWEYDDKVIAPLYGFRDAADYYESCSCRQFLPTVEVPTHILHALDDPLIPATALPEERELPAHVSLELSPKGGHVGFIRGASPLRPVYWMEEHVPALLASLMPQAPTPLL